MWNCSLHMANLMKLAHDYVKIWAKEDVHRMKCGEMPCLLLSLKIFGGCKWGRVRGGQIGVLVDSASATRELIRQFLVPWCIFYRTTALPFHSAMFQFSWNSKRKSKNWLLLSSFTTLHSSIHAPFPLTLKKKHHNQTWSCNVISDLVGNFGSKQE